MESTNDFENDSRESSTLSFTTMPLDEIMPGSVVRVAVKSNVQYACLRDLIRYGTGKNPNDSAKIWRNIPDHFKDELKPFLLNLKFPGRGHSVQPAVTFPGALKLFMFLPGETAKINRAHMTRASRRSCAWCFFQERFLIKKFYQQKLLREQAFLITQKKTRMLAGRQA
jgi:hypothetical protein